MSESKTRINSFPEHTLVIMMNMQYKMSKGKMVSQAVHVTAGFYRCYRQVEPHDTCIVIKCSSEEAFNNAWSYATDQRWPNYVHEDAGLTEVPEGAPTCMALYISNDKVKSFTHQYKLL